MSSSSGPARTGASLAREIIPDQAAAPSVETPDGAPAVAGREVAEVAGPRRVLLVGSSGGHLAQLVALEPWYAERERTWVTFNTLDARSQLSDERVFWAAFPTTRNLPNLLRNTLLAIRLVPRERPDVVVSTGAAVALPFFLVAKLLGIRTVFIEVYDRLDTRTMTARLCRPFTDLFCVQWEEQKALYPDATVIGHLL
jgi:UDP-N-acetylglucosamine:LPS N-acetylglucosamine transferase